jgi:TatD DNase family protein
MSLARSSSAVYPFIDIGANLLDPMFQGIYREKALHAPDLPFVIERAKKFGCLNIFCTAGSLEDSKRALQFVREFNSSTSSTSTTATAADDLTSRKFLRSTVRFVEYVCCLSRL